MKQKIEPDGKPIRLFVLFRRPANGDGQSVHCVCDVVVDVIVDGFAERLDHVLVHHLNGEVHRQILRRIVPVGNLETVDSPVQCFRYVDKRLLLM